MAMMKCPECGGNVSDKAEVCPHCGYYRTKRCLQDGTILDVPLGGVLFKIFAIITWIGGFIVAIWLGKKLGPVFGDRDSFSFWTFLVSCVAFGIQGGVYYAISELIEMIGVIHDRIGFIKMDRGVK